MKTEGLIVDLENHFLMLKIHQLSELHESRKKHVI